MTKLKDENYITKFCIIELKIKKLLKKKDFDGAWYRLEMSKFLNKADRDSINNMIEDAEDAEPRVEAPYEPLIQKKEFYPHTIFGGSSLSIENVNMIYKRLSMVYHPDRGGSDEAMAMLNAARKQMLICAKKQINLLEELD